jgi:hypothetical protein
VPDGDDLGFKSMDGRVKPDHDEWGGKAFILNVMVGRDPTIHPLKTPNLGAELLAD